MATVTKGKTFSSNETVTAAKLHQLVDDATVTDIVLADFSAGVRPATAATGAPSSPTKGDLWVDTSLTDPQVHAARADGTFAKLYAVPTGACMEWPAATIPEGWLECDGSAVSRTTYADLFAVIGTTWGVGDGSTTFNVPDDRGRVAVGAGTGSGLTARTLAATGGEETHVLTTAELAAHTHQETVGDTGVPTTLSAATRAQAGSGGSAKVPATATVGAHSTDTPAINTQSTGSDSGHNTMQPFNVKKKIIRT